MAVEDVFRRALVLVLARFQVPEADGLVERGRGEPSAVGAEGEAEDDVVMARQVADRGPLRQRVDPQRARSRGQAGADRELVAVAAEGQGVDLPGEVAQDQSGLP